MHTCTLRGGYPPCSVMAVTSVCSHACVDGPSLSFDPRPGTSFGARKGRGGGSWGWRALVRPSVPERVGEGVVGVSRTHHISGRLSWMTGCVCVRDPVVGPEVTAEIDNLAVHVTGAS